MEYRSCERVFMWVCVILLCSTTLCHGYRLYYMEKICGGGRGTGTLDLSKVREDYGRMQVTDGPGYRRYLNCRVRVVPPPGKGLVMRINRLEIYRRFWGCTTDYFSVFRDDESSQIGVAMCGYAGKNYIRAAYIPPNHTLYLRFVSGDWFWTNYRVGVDLVFTSYHTGPCNPNPNITNDFECRGRENGRMCVPVKLKCDQYDNCGDLSDESTDYANCPFRGLSAGQIVGIVVGVLLFILLVAMCVVWLVNRKHARKENQRMRDPSTRSVAMVEVGGAEPPPPYTTYVNTTVTTGGYPNPAYVAPPAYTTQQEAQGGATTQDTGTGTNKAAEASGVSQNTEQTQRK